MSSNPRSTAMKAWWSDPANKELVKRRRLEERAKREGTTVEALMRPRTWAPIAERREVYAGLYREGLTDGEVWKLYPNEDVGVLVRVRAAVQHQQEEATRQRRRRSRHDETPEDREEAKKERARKVQAAWTPEKRAAASARSKAIAVQQAAAQEARVLAEVEARRRQRELDELL